MAAPLGQALSPELMAASAVFFGVFGMVLAVASLGARKSVQVHARLARHALTVDTGELALAGGFTGLTQPFARTTPLLAKRLGALSFVRASQETLVRANVRFGVARYYLMRALLAAVVFGLVHLVAGVLPAVGAAAVAFMIPRIVISKKASRRGAAFEGQLAETLDLLVGSLRAGQGLLQALEAASSEQSEPMRSELQRIVDQVNLGVSISDAMEKLTSRFDSPDVELLAAAIAINRETGGNLTEVLERLAKTVRQRREIRAEAKSLTAAPRMTSYVLAILPIAIASYCVAISPIYRHQLLEVPTGRILLVGAIIWSLIGFFISQKLAKAEY